MKINLLIKILIYLFLIIVGIAIGVLIKRDFNRTETNTNNEKISDVFSLKYDFINKDKISYSIYRPQNYDVAISYPEIWELKSAENFESDNGIFRITFNDKYTNDSIVCDIYKIKEWLKGPRTNEKDYPFVYPLDQRQNIKTFLDNIYKDKKISDSSLTLMKKVSSTLGFGYEPEFDINPYYISNSNNDYRGFAKISPLSAQSATSSEMYHSILYNPNSNLAVSFLAYFHSAEAQVLDSKFDQATGENLPSNLLSEYRNSYFSNFKNTPRKYWSVGKILDFYDFITKLVQ